MNYELTPNFGVSMLFNVVEGGLTWFNDCLQARSTIVQQLFNNLKLYSTTFNHLQPPSTIYQVSELNMCGKV
jgi:hypothetical protein